MGEGLALAQGAQFVADLFQQRQLRIRLLFLFLQAAVTLQGSVALVIGSTITK